MPTLHHPRTGATHTVASEKVARRYRQSGWVDHPGDVEYRCGDCGRTFGTARGVAVHSRSHDPPGPPGQDDRPPETGGSSHEHVGDDVPADTPDKEDETWRA